MRRRRRGYAQINVVPYIDVMLVLLVIFMVTAPLLTPGVVNLPKVGQAEQVETSPLEIVLHDHGALDLRAGQAPLAQGLSLEALADRLRTELAPNPERPVVISADGQVRYESVMRVVDYLQRQQVSRVGLLVNTDSR